MDTNHVLLWIVIISTTLTGLRTVRLGIKKHSSWLLTTLLVLAVTLLALYFTPDIAGLVGGVIWGFFFLIPSLATRLMNHFILKQDFDKALLFSRIIVAFHPAKTTRALPQMMKQLAAREKGLVNASAHPLEEQSRWDIIQKFQNSHQWEEFLTWANAHLQPEEIKNDFNCIVMMIRSLGETGRINELLCFYNDHRTIIENTGSLSAAFPLMFALSFAGEVEAVQDIFAGSLKSCPQKTKDLWMATAFKARGNILTPESRKILGELKHEFVSQQRFGVSPHSSTIKPIWTYLFLALNTMIFISELLLGGSTDPLALMTLGALIPDAVFAGEWWRILAANFIHYGWLHYSMNMIALYYLGPYVEYALGGWRSAVCYLASGILGMSGIVYLAHIEIMEPQIMVGASGCIMGLIGATAAILLRGWSASRSRAASRRLLSLALIIFLQVIFDLSTPEVSFTVHLLGLLTGFVITMFMKHAFAK